MHDYIMNITLAKGSGEYCISHILEPGAHARMPLVDRIHALRKDLPVTFVYGDHDWMDPVGGEESIRNLRKAGNSLGKMYIIENAGHHGTLYMSEDRITPDYRLYAVYLDNKDAVNELLLRELDK